MTLSSSSDAEIAVTVYKEPRLLGLIRGTESCLIALRHPFFVGRPLSDLASLTMPTTDSTAGEVKDTLQLNPIVSNRMQLLDPSFRRWSPYICSLVGQDSETRLLLQSVRRIWPFPIVDAALMRNTADNPSLDPALMETLQESDPMSSADGSPGTMLKLSEAIAGVQPTEKGGLAIRLRGPLATNGEEGDVVYVAVRGLTAQGSLNLGFDSFNFMDRAVNYFAVAFSLLPYVFVLFICLIFLQQSGESKASPGPSTNYVNLHRSNSSVRRPPLKAVTVEHRKLLGKQTALSEK